MSWLSSYFLNPAYLLPGMALLSVPVVIHLINRLRYRRVRFAAMEFLLASQQKNRRRLLLEQLLLLLLRLLAVAALVMLIARPILDPDKLSLFQGTQTHHLVLLDDSGSMGDRWGDKTAFAGALDVIRKIAGEGERRPDTQALSLMLLSRPDDPLLKVERVNKDFVRRLERILEKLPCSHQAPDLATAINAARKFFAEQKSGTKNFHFVSDFRRTDWESGDALPAALQTLAADKIAINLVPTVPQRHENLAVTDLSGSIHVAAAGVPIRLKATVRNYGEKAATKIALTILADNVKLPASPVIEKIESGSEVSQEFDVVFTTSGPHEVLAKLPADALEQDNERFLALNVAENLPILIIDGAASDSEAFYLQDALAPATGVTGYAPSIESVEYLRRNPLDRFKSIFVLNVAELPLDTVQTLEEYVAAGGGLVWFAGPNLRAAYYNDKLYKGGRGLFPVKLGSISELATEDSEATPDIKFTTHPLFRIFEGQENPFSQLLRVNRYYGVARDWQPSDGTQVIATLRNKAPLFLESRFGQGTIVTCLTTCGSLWNNWPIIPPAFVSMTLELQRLVARRDTSLSMRIVGEPIAVNLELGMYSPDLTIGLPGGGIEKRKASTRESGKGDEKGKGPTPATAKVTEKTQPSKEPAKPADAAPTAYIDRFTGTDTPGMYTLTLQRMSGGAETRRFAYNVPLAESSLDLTTPQQMQERVGAGVAMKIQQVGDFQWIHTEQAGQEVMDFVLLALLILLVVEQALALRLSFHPKGAGGRA
jgi:hypothetical protein